MPFHPSSNWNRNVRAPESHFNHRILSYTEPPAAPDYSSQSAASHQRSSSAEAVSSHNNHNHRSVSATSAAAHGNDRSASSGMVFHTPPKERALFHNPYLHVKESSASKRAHSNDPNRLSAVAASGGVGGAAGEDRSHSAASIRSPSTYSNMAAGRSPSALSHQSNIHHPSSNNNNHKHNNNKKKYEGGGGGVRASTSQGRSASAHSVMSNVADGTSSSSSPTHQELVWEKEKQNMLKLSSEQLVRKSLQMHFDVLRLRRKRAHDAANVYRLRKCREFVSACSDCVRDATIRVALVASPSMSAAAAASSSTSGIPNDSTEESPSSAVAAAAAASGESGGESEDQQQEREEQRRKREQRNSFKKFLEEEFASEEHNHSPLAKILLTTQREEEEKTAALIAHSGGRDQKESFFRSVDPEEDPGPLHAEPDLSKNLSLLLDALVCAEATNERIIEIAQREKQRADDNAAHIESLDEAVKSLQAGRVELLAMHAQQTEQYELGLSDLRIRLQDAEEAHKAATQDLRHTTEAQAHRIEDLERVAESLQINLENEQQLSQSLGQEKENNDRAYAAEVRMLRECMDNQASELAFNSKQSRDLSSKHESLVKASSEKAVLDEEEIGRLKVELQFAEEASLLRNFGTQRIGKLRILLKGQKRSVGCETDFSESGEMQRVVEQSRTVIDAVHEQVFALNDELESRTKRFETEITESKFDNALLVLQQQEAANRARIWAATENHHAKILQNVLFAPIDEPVSILETNAEEEESTYFCEEAFSVDFYSRAAPAQPVVSANQSRSVSALSTSGQQQQQIQQQQEGGGAVSDSRSTCSAVALPSMINKQRREQQQQQQQKVSKQSSRKSSKQASRQSTPNEESIEEQQEGEDAEEDEEIFESEEVEELRYFHKKETNWHNVLQEAWHHQPTIEERKEKRKKWLAVKKQEEEEQRKAKEKEQEREEPQQHQEQQQQQGEGEPIDVNMQNSLTSEIPPPHETSTANPSPMNSTRDVLLSADPSALSNEEQQQQQQQTGEGEGEKQQQQQEEERKQEQALEGSNNTNDSTTGSDFSSPLDQLARKTLVSDEQLASSKFDPAQFGTKTPPPEKHKSQQQTPRQEEGGGGESGIDLFTESLENQQKQEQQQQQQQPSLLSTEHQETQTDEIIPLQQVQISNMSMSSLPANSNLSFSGVPAAKSEEEQKLRETLKKVAGQAKLLHGKLVAALSSGAVSEREQKERQEMFLQEHYDKLQMLRKSMLIVPQLVAQNKKLLENVSLSRKQVSEQKQRNEGDLKKVQEEAEKAVKALQEKLSEQEIESSKNLQKQLEEMAKMKQQKEVVVSSAEKEQSQEKEKEGEKVGNSKNNNNNNRPKIRTPSRAPVSGERRATPKRPQDQHQQKQQEQEEKTEEEQKSRQVEIQAEKEQPKKPNQEEPKKEEEPEHEEEEEEEQPPLPPQFGLPPTNFQGRNNRPSTSRKSAGKQAVTAISLPPGVPVPKPTRHRTPPRGNNNNSSSSSQQPQEQGGGSGSQHQREVNEATPLKQIQLPLDNINNREDSNSPTPRQFHYVPGSKTPPLGTSPRNSPSRFNDEIMKLLESAQKAFHTADTEAKQLLKYLEPTPGTVGEKRN